MVWDAESLWITLSNIQLFTSHSIAPFILGWLMMGTFLWLQLSKQHQQQNRGQVHPLPTTELSGHLANSSSEACSTTNPNEQGSEDKVHHAKPQEHWELPPVKAHSTSTYKPQSRLLWVYPLKRVDSCRRSSLKWSSATFKMHQN